MLRSPNHASPAEFGRAPAPCPFCDRPNVAVYVGRTYHVTCLHCGADGPPSNQHPCEAIDLWDRRLKRVDPVYLPEKPGSRS